MNHLFNICSLAMLLAIYCGFSSAGRYTNRVIGRYDTVERHKRLKEPNKMRDCEFNICQNLANYPEGYVKNIIEKHAALHSYFGNIIEPSNDSVSIFNRVFDDDVKPEPFCKTVDRTILPQLMVDVDNVERYIANVADYKQAIKFQTCDTEHGNGDCFAGSLLDHDTRCMQKYNVIKLVTVNLDSQPHGNALEYRKFRIPSTCVCTYFKKHY